MLKSLAKCEIVWVNVILCSACAIDSVIVTAFVVNEVIIICIAEGMNVGSIGCIGVDVYCCVCVICVRVACATCIVRRCVWLLLIVLLKM